MLRGRADRRTGDPHPCRPADDARRQPYNRRRCREREPTYAPAGSDGELRILSGPGAGATAPVRGGSATIGREPECDLQVLDSEVSRRHAKVTIRDGVASIDDLHSANGTYVNGERILGSYDAGARRPDPDRRGDDRADVAGVRRGRRSARCRSAGHRRPRRAQRSRPSCCAESGSRKWWTLAVVLTTTFMLLLDVTIVGVAMPVDLERAATELLRAAVGRRRLHDRR